MKEYLLRPVYDFERNETDVGVYPRTSLWDTTNSCLSSKRATTVFRLKPLVEDEIL